MTVSWPMTHLHVQPEGPQLHALIPRYPGHPRTLSEALQMARHQCDVVSYNGNSAFLPEGSALSSP